MIDHILAPENSIFLVTLCLFLLIFLIQGASVIAGMEPFSFLDGLLPDVDFDAPEAHPIGFMDSIMSMLKMGKVPFIFSFILFLFLFSLIGLYGQLVLFKLGLPMLHWAIATPAAFVATLPVLRIGNGILEKVLPKDETYAISNEEFIGRTATITIGTATELRAAEAKVVGSDHKTHYIMVIADNAGKAFSTGDETLIVGRRSEGLYAVIENKNPLLNK